MLPVNNPLISICSLETLLPDIYFDDVEIKNKELVWPIDYQNPKDASDDEIKLQKLWEEYCNLALSEPNEERLNSLKKDIDAIIARIGITKLVAAITNVATSIISNNTVTLGYYKPIVISNSCPTYNACVDPCIYFDFRKEHKDKHSVHICCKSIFSNPSNITNSEIGCA